MLRVVMQCPKNLVLKYFLRHNWIAMFLLYLILIIPRVYELLVEQSACQGKNARRQYVSVWHGPERPAMPLRQLASIGCHLKVELDGATVTQQMETGNGVMVGAY